MLNKCKINIDTYLFSFIFDIIAVIAVAYGLVLIQKTDLS